MQGASPAFYKLIPLHRPLGGPRGKTLCRMPLVGLRRATGEMKKKIIVVFDTDMLLLFYAVCILRIDNFYSYASRNVFLQICLKKHDVDELSVTFI